MQGGLVRPAFAVLSAGILESTVNTETEKDRFMSENTKNPAAEEFLPCLFYTSGKTVPILSF